MGLQKTASNKNDGHASMPQGKTKPAKLEGMSTDIAGGAFNYKSTAGSEKKVGK